MCEMYVRDRATCDFILKIKGLYSIIWRNFFEDRIVTTKSKIATKRGRAEGIKAQTP